MTMSNKDKGSPTLRDARPLVSEARPIPWEHLSDDERNFVTSRADAWIEAVTEDSEREKPEAHEIDESRTGRVLFIDGPRGAGKTSFLLTLLKRWTAKTNQSSDYGHGPCNSNLRVFLPVLDFDPLPHGMPLHGWLLEPWRKRAQNLDRNSVAGAAGIHSGDLSELFADLFERVVVGWTPAHTEGKGVVDKALVYQERASGWLETSDKWNKFVGNMVCRESKCSDENCRHAHQLVFVIAIDDVDLQVEHLPQLLHAIRLLNHPNVAYVLTGNYEHLRFALLLDYLRRHGQQTDQNNPKSPWNDIDAHSRRLRDAFLEKTLPSHALISLPYLSFDGVLALSAGRYGKVKDVLRNQTGEALLKALCGGIRRLPIVTARRAQHATDRFLESRSGEKSIFEFVADLCGTKLESEDLHVPDVRPKFAIRGVLTTRMGLPLKVLHGDRLKLVLTDQPRFEFLQDFDDKNLRVGEEAHQALLVQILTEATRNVPTLAIARALEWTPDEGIATTHVQWNPGSTSVAKVADFHWPWLVRPSARQVLELGELSKKLSDATGNSLASLEESMVALWIHANIDWWLQQPTTEGRFLNIPNEQAAPAAKLMTATSTVGEQDCLPTSAANAASTAGSADRTSIEGAAMRLTSLRDSNSDSEEVKREMNRWVRELYVMTAPYFGLPIAVAKLLRDNLKNCVEAGELSPQELWEEQKTMVGNAIMAKVSRDPGERSLEAFTLKFLKQRRKRAEKNIELWIDEPAPPSKSPDGAQQIPPAQGSTGPVAGG
ncbi:hypothetical protein WME88_12635 [Sorangium sp. So ce216]